MDKDAYYFSHDSNARHDPKIVKMLTKYEYGYQWYFMIIEILREQADYKYKMDEYYGNAIARDLHTDCKAIVNFIRDCIKEFNLFSTDGDVFWSESLLRRMEIKEQKSQTYRENAKKRWDKQDVKGDAIAMQLQCNGNAVKESKGKEKKVKEKRGFVAPTVEQVKEYFKVNQFPEYLAIKAFNHYDVAGWKDTKGNPVRNWKQKMNSVWFDEEKKIKETVTPKKLTMADYDRMFGGETK